MKKTAPTIVSLVLGIAIGFFICKEFYCPKLDCSTCEPDCSDCPTTGACTPTSETPNGIISVAEAVELHEAYENNNSFHYQDSLYTEFVWFEYDRIKQYIGYLEEVQRKNPNNAPISGIRVYFGAYGTAHVDYPSQQTVFFTPTIDTKLNESYSNMKNLPFSIQPTGNDPLVGTYKVIRGLILDEYNPDERTFMANNNLNGKNTREEGQTTVQKSAQAKDGNDETSLSYNMGQLSPPPPRN